MSKLLPADKNLKLLGLNNRLLFAIGNAAFFSIVEIFLAQTPAFVTVYTPFFLAAFYCYDWPPKTQAAFICVVAGLDVLMMVVFAALLGWI